MEIQLINGSVIKFAGSNNFNGLMGTNPVTILYSEYSLHNPLARQYLNPILVENGGFEMVQCTPRGMNHAYEMMQAVQDNPKYLVQVLGVDKTFKDDGSPVITKEQIEDARKMGMSDEMIRQEFYCLTPETLITTPNGCKRIKDISINDVVISHTGRCRKVLKLYNHRFKGKIYKIWAYGNYNPLKITGNHEVRIYAPETQSYWWVRADKIKKGDFVTARHGCGFYVKNVTSMQYDGDVHNIAVDKDNSYIANNIIVHNCDFEVGNVGAYFTREMTQLLADGRYTQLKADPRLPLHSCWDLGSSDATAGWLFQCVGHYVHLLHLVHGADQGLKHHLEEAERYRQSVGCNWGHHFMPHDIDQEHQGWEHVQSRLIQARQHGWHFLITPKVAINDGIEQMRYVLERTRINKPNCDLGIRGLREYQRKFDEVKGVFDQKPMHNWASDIADAFRYLSINYRRLFELPQTPKSYDYIS